MAALPACYPPVPPTSATPTLLPTAFPQHAHHPFPFYFCYLLFLFPYLPPNPHRHWHYFAGATPVTRRARSSCARARTPLYAARDHDAAPRSRHAPPRHSLYISCLLLLLPTYNLRYAIYYRGMRQVCFCCIRITRRSFRAQHIAFKHCILYAFIARMAFGWFGTNCWFIQRLGRLLRCLRKDDTSLPPHLHLAPYYRPLPYA